LTTSGVSMEWFKNTGSIGSNQFVMITLFTRQFSVNFTLILHYPTNLLFQSENDQLCGDSSNSKKGGKHIEKKKTKAPKTYTQSLEDLQTKSIKFFDNQIEREGARRTRTRRRRRITFC
jgi:hypothetical protein